MIGLMLATVAAQVAPSTEVELPLQSVKGVDMAFMCQMDPFTINTDGYLILGMQYTNDFKRFYLTYHNINNGKMIVLENSLKSFKISDGQNGSRKAFIFVDTTFNNKNIQIKLNTNHISGVEYWKSTTADISFEFENIRFSAKQCNEVPTLLNMRDEKK